MRDDRDKPAALTECPWHQGHAKPLPIRLSFSPPHATLRVGARSISSAANFTWRASEDSLSLVRLTSGGNPHGSPGLYFLGTERRIARKT